MLLNTYCNLKSKNNSLHKMKNKHILNFIICMFSVLCLSCSSEYVYICTGPSSSVYHKTDDCRGLNRCSDSIDKVTVKEAKEMGRRACKICE